MQHYILIKSGEDYFFRSEFKLSMHVPCKRVTHRSQASSYVYNYILSYLTYPECPLKLVSLIINTFIFAVRTTAYNTQIGNTVFILSATENNSKDRQSTTAATQQQQQQQQQLLKPTIKVTEEELKALGKNVIISKDQTRDVHDGIVKRLKEASERQVDIQRIILRDSFTSVEDNGVAINLSSGAVLPPLNTLKGLKFENEKWQQWDLTKLISILQYACHRSPPTEIIIERSLLPFKFENKLSTLQQKPPVVWQTGDESAGILHLNYDTEQWESISHGPLNESVYYMLIL
ncbi:uncharacterized protein [Apostichopus japonicus]|uniref:uncharacterized protein isoform X2 n=1 Tax=Stichopus japonicus TaxID=307972 RepID=UPI003AB6230F